MARKRGGLRPSVYQANGGASILARHQSDRTVGDVKLLKPPASSLCSQRKIRQSITRRTAPASGQARFGFSIRVTTLSASFRSTTRIESCDAMTETHETARIERVIVEQSLSPGALMSHFLSMKYRLF